jgi:membrane protease YdiL (CAAX protease family)
MNADLSNRKNTWRIVTFLALTFGLSSIFYVKIVTGGEGIEPWVLPLMLCPSVSAILTKLIFDRSLKGMGWKPGPARWLGLGYLLPILYGAVIYGIAWLIGLGGFTTDVIAEVIGTGLGMADASTGQLVVVYILFLATIVFVRQGLLSSFGEDLGWRGFLFPELHRMTSFTTASLISGVVWTLYHLPLILFSDYHSTAPIAFQVVVFFISTIAHTFVLNWLRAKSGSVWPAVFLHTSHNVFFKNVYDPMMTRNPFTDYFVTEFGLGMMVINLLMALYVWSRRSEVDPKPEASMVMTAMQPTAAD